jgi:hypothetical protein
VRERSCRVAAPAARAPPGILSHLSSDGGDALPGLVWSGDLDGDRRLDLVLDVTDHDNVSEPTLFLSTRAHQGQAVGRAAALRTTGC